MNFAKFAETLTDDECVECINDYEQFSEDGMIGDCMLRRKATEYTDLLNDIVNVSWMDMLANQCHRRFALRYIADNGMTDDGPPDWGKRWYEWRDWDGSDEYGPLEGDQSEHVVQVERRGPDPEHYLISEAHHIGWKHDGGREDVLRFRLVNERG